MNLMDKLERKFKNFGIPNLTTYMVACYVIGYVIQTVGGDLADLLSLNVNMILRGQLWRLVTWVLTTPRESFLMLLIAIVFFYYPIGQSLENTIGKFRYTLFILGGVILTIIGAFIVHFAAHGLYDGYARYIYTTYYISMSVFIAYASIHPNSEVLLWFLFPIKMKWMAIVYAAIVIYDMIGYWRQGLWVLIVPILASIINMLLFFLANKDLRRYHPKEVQRRREFRRAMEPQSRASGMNSSKVVPISKHKCAICGRTELDSPDLEFRFCSKCNGNYEYCQDHLYTHQHIQ